jgi:Zn-dependent membrane protease YugP
MLVAPTAEGDCVRVLIILAVMAMLAALPSIWIGSVLRRHGRERADIPRTGAEAARSMLDRLGLGHVRVEKSELGDHYDPEDKAVRLSPERFDSRSLAAVVVAAHEVGHAMQDAVGYTPLVVRTRFARQAAILEKVGVGLMLLSPFAMAMMPSRAGLFLSLAFGAFVLVLPIIMHAATLPVEYDASFRRAIPLLAAGRYVSERDMPAARQLLHAAAFTYVAAAIFSVLNVVRWLRVLRI